MAVSINRVRNDMAVFCMIRAARSSAYVDMATHRSASDDRRTLRLVPFTSACGSCIGSLAQRDGVRASAPTGYLRTLRNAISGRSSHFGPASFSVATLHFFSRRTLEPSIIRQGRSRSRWSPRRTQIAGYAWRASFGRTTSLRRVTQGAFGKTIKANSTLVAPCHGITRIMATDDLHIIRRKLRSDYFFTDLPRADDPSCERDS